MQLHSDLIVRAAQTSAANWWGNAPVLVAIASVAHYSTYVNQSSSTYQCMLPLSTKGTYGGIFDAANSANNSSVVVALGANIHQTTGAITFGTPSVLYSIASSPILSTCQFGACGMAVMNIGHHQNPVYGTTNKGWCYAARFDSAGNVAVAGNGEAPANMWPHSNGDLILGGSDTYIRGRRSSYNSNTGQFASSASVFTLSNGAVSYEDYSNITGDTSTNYTSVAIPQTRNSTTRPGGLINYRSGSGNVIPVYGASCARGAASDAISMFGVGWLSGEVIGFELSTGSIIWYGLRSTARVLQTGNSLTKLSNHAGWQQILIGSDCTLRNSIPLGNNRWIVSTILGIALIAIDPSTYTMSVVKIIRMEAFFGGNLSTSIQGYSMAIDGATDQFFVVCNSNGAQASINVFQNPFAGL